MNHNTSLSDLFVEGTKLEIGGVSGTIFATGGCPPSRFALRRTTFDGARVTRPANRSRERSERWRRLAERVGFEPTCRLRDKTLSRRPRYDHFGTSPLRQDRFEQKFDYSGVVVATATGKRSPRPTHPGRRPSARHSVTGRAGSVQSTPMPASYICARSRGVRWVAQRTGCRPSGSGLKIR